MDDRAGPEQELETEQVSAHNQSRLRGALQELDERSREIIQTRWLSDNKATLHELADKFQVSAERIRQIEQNAIKKLRVGFADQLS